MSFHSQRLRQLRRAAGLDPLPESIYRKASVAGFVDSIDPRFCSPAARYWHDQVCDYVASGEVMPLSEREAFKLVGSVLRMARDERDERIRRDFLMPSATTQRNFASSQKHRAAEFVKSILLEEEMWRRGYRYGPDYELPNDVVIPSADGIFDRWAADSTGVTEGAIKQKRLRWRAAHRRAVRLEV